MTVVDGGSVAQHTPSPMVTIRRIAGWELVLSRHLRILHLMMRIVTTVPVAISVQQTTKNSLFLIPFFAKTSFFIGVFHLE